MKLVILCGISGAGKTDAFLKRHFSDFKDFVYLSTDDVRAVIGKDRTDQTVNGKTFENIKWNIEYFLRQGKDVVVDATNPTPSDRKNLLKAATRAEERGSLFSDRLSSKIERIAYVKFVPLQVALTRNANRSRIVPEDIIRRQAAKFSIPTITEGFDTIVVDSD